MRSPERRLLRRNCPHCAAEASLTPDELAELRAPLPLLSGGVQLMRGAGCARCRGTGYLGRIGVFEILNVDAPVRELVARQALIPQIVESARRTGLRTLRESAVRKLAQGVTTFEEVVRMTSA